MLSTMVNSDYQILAYGGQEVADEWCEINGYALAGSFLKMQYAGLIWPVGTNTIEGGNSTTGMAATGYEYITCLTSPDQSPLLALDENGNIGYGNTGKNNIGNFNSGVGNVGNFNGGDNNIGDFHPKDSSGNTG